MELLVGWGLGFLCGALLSASVFWGGQEKTNDEVNK